MRLALEPTTETGSGNSQVITQEFAPARSVGPECTWTVGVGLYAASGSGLEGAEVAEEYVGLLGLLFDWGAGCAVDIVSKTADGEGVT